MENDKVFDKLVDKILVLNLVAIVWNGYQGGAETDGKIIRVHHVLIAV